jgi:hypothetical protein
VSARQTKVLIHIRAGCLVNVYSDIKGVEVELFDEDNIHADVNIGQNTNAECRPSDTGEGSYGSSS